MRATRAFGLFGAISGFHVCLIFHHDAAPCGQNTLSFAEFSRC